MESFLDIEAMKARGARDFLKRQIDKFPTELPTQTIVEHANANRIMPPGSPIPGPLDLNVTPYLKEILENMSPFSPIQITSVMKAAQLGFTMALECILCYYMGYCPADQLFTSASDKSIDKWAGKRLEPAINSYGYRDLIKTVETSSNRRSGDKVFSKQYYGMQLDLVTQRSGAGLRASDKRILLNDEVDGSPPELPGGEGLWMDVVYARTNAWADRRKVANVSTPKRKDDSQILVAVNEGDKREFYVPCISCGEAQPLVMDNLHADTEAGIITAAYYACQGCGECWQNYHKDFFLIKGDWVPQKISSSKVIRSYLINSLYSPNGMLSWLEIAQKRQKAKDSADPVKRASFTNLYAGLPTRDEGSRPKIEVVVQNRGDYPSFEIPDTVLFLTLAVDVQAGSKKTDPKGKIINPARLELEILGHGPGYRTSSVGYIVFEGSIDDAYSGAWEKLNQWGIDTGLTFKKQNGKEFSVVLSGVDSGDGNYTHIVYQFCQRWNNCFPIKGRNKIDAKGLDKASGTDHLKFRISKVGEEIIYLISTNHYKTRTYSTIKIRRGDSKIPPKGYQDFPKDYKKKYFKMLTAEEKLLDGNFYCSKGTRNEALDVRVYNLALGDIYLNELLKDQKEFARKQGATKEQCAEFDVSFIIQQLKEELGVVD